MKAVLENGQINVHGYERQIEIQRRLLDEADIHEDNRALIKKFIDFCNVDTKVGLSRIRLYYYTLRKIAGLVDKSFKEMTEDDIIRVLSLLRDSKTITGQKYSEESIRDFRKAISKFWRWMFYDQYHGEAPPQIRRIKTGHQNNGRKEPEIYTKEEIRAIVNGMDTIRDKAFFTCLYDLQCRVSELLSRQIKHIRYTEDGDTQILIEADKTGNSHWETLYESVALFTTWLKFHPAPDDPNAPLWTAKRGPNELVPLSYARARNIFMEVCKKYRIKEGKKNIIHMIRKSKATHDLADGVPITYIESRGSWTKGSRAMHDCYLAVLQKDKDSAYRKKYNMPVNVKPKDVKELKRCRRCDTILDQDARFCARCGMPADLKTAIKVKKIDDQIENIVDEKVLSTLVKKYVVAELKRITKK